jgi:hypothetical protein
MRKIIVSISDLLLANAWSRAECMMKRYAQGQSQAELYASNAGGWN